MHLRGQGFTFKLQPPNSAQEPTSHSLRSYSAAQRQSVIRTKALRSRGLAIDNCEAAINGPKFSSAGGVPAARARRADNGS
jgi:hypothetical protein